MTANPTKSRKMIIDLDELDPAIAVMIDQYPHDIEQVKSRFYLYWPLFDLIGAEATAATLKADVDQLCFTAASLLAIWLCGFTSGLGNVQTAWSAAYRFIQIEGDEDEGDEQEGDDKIIHYPPHHKKGNI